MHRLIMGNIEPTPRNPGSDSNNANPQDKEKASSLFLLFPQGKLALGNFVLWFLYLLFFSQT